MDDLEVNIEGTEEIVNDIPVGDDSYTSSEDEIEEDIEFDADEFTLDGFHEEELELDDFVNDEH